MGGPLEVVIDCDSSAAHLDHPVHFRRATTDPKRNRGLSVNERGTNVDGIAFVLLSHGRSGRGAFGMESGVRTVLPTSPDELRNTQGPSSPVWNSPFVINPRSDFSIAPDAAGHFDDIVSFMAATDLIERAKLGARAWLSSSLVPNAPTIQALVPGFDPDDTQNTGRTSLQFGRVTVTARSNAGTQNIGFRERGGIGGIGVTSTSPWITTGGTISSTNNEVLRFDAGAGSTFQKVDVAFNEFQTRTFWPFARERVEISLWQDGDLLQASTVSSWHSDPDLPSRCLFESIPGTIFDRMDVSPKSRLADSGASTLTVAGVRACSVAVDSCQTSIPGAVDCPIPPPSTTTDHVSALQTSAILKGYANDRGATTALTFEYGTSCSYPLNIASSPANIDAGAGVTAISANVTGLTCNTGYYFRTKAVSSGGITYSGGRMFNTPACTAPMPRVATSTASNISTTSATLMATVDANGSTTTVSFDFGDSQCYGTSITATPSSVSAGTGNVAVSALASGLVCNSRYHYRVRGVNSDGTSTGLDSAFTTAPCP